MVCTQHMERRVLGCKTHLTSRCWDAKHILHYDAGGALLILAILILILLAAASYFDKGERRRDVRIRITGDGRRVCQGILGHIFYPYKT